MISLGFTIRVMFFGGLTIIACLISSPIQAESSIAAVSVKVTIIGEPCSINNGEPITVDFGQIQRTKVDGSNYIKTIEYDLDCPNAISDDLVMTFTGVGAVFDKDVLQTDQTALGIKIINNGNSMTLNQPVNFNRSVQPVLQAVPVKDPANELIESAFNASATMSIDYQ